MLQIKFNALIPELFVANFQKSIDFYTQTLGFKIEYGRDNPDFAFLSFHECQIMIQQEEEDDEDYDDWHNAKPIYPFGTGINFQIRTDDVQLMIDKLNAVDYPLKRKLKECCYHIKNTTLTFLEFMVMDPDGYLLRFVQQI